MIVSAILYLTLCTSDCSTKVVAKFSQGEGGALLCEAVARGMNRAPAVAGAESLYVCKRQPNGLEG